ncbi:aldehyde dehydrogenase family protein [Devosia sp. SL43]|uniref:aldehyde dehydrogenase family protein n=1 Tax=Devosia sp. SL43 TaxID=2806348 RepID=UPI001F346E9C|nr:aldehyde dehydrogenase family protein [Devosia sp. SL43]UJW83981.1 aldehyde dehydrogenase family protein [Devosia sp. SL43]
MNKFRLLIGGALVDGDLTLAVVNPATEEVLAHAPRASLNQLNAAVAAAKSAFPQWAATPIAERRQAMLALADAIDMHADELGRLLTQEQGRPLDHTMGEVRGTAQRFRYWAEQTLDVEVLEDSDDMRVEAHRKPLGVVAAIVPWNFPLGMMSWKVAPSLLVGNTLVVKPAPTTPLTTLRLGELARDLLPPGVLNIITDDNDLGATLAEHPDVAKVSFTGSIATGRKVMASGAVTLKHLTLELGGNDAAIVLDDVNPAKIAAQLFGGAFYNSGQVCTAIKRLYVHASVYDQICDELAKLADQAVVGDGLDQGTEFGPINNRRQFEKVKELLADARINGTVMPSSNGAAAERGYFIRPTIVRDIQEGSRLVDEEQFGPVLPVLKFSEDEDALARANNTLFGLGGSIWSSNAERAYALADRLEAGMVWINRHGGAWDHIPFLGSKQSGIGSELGGARALEEYTQLKIVNIKR